MLATKKDPKQPRLRVERVNSLIQELLGPLVAEYTLEAKGLVTISKVETSNDLKHAKVWLSVLGADEDKVFQILTGQLYNIQGELNRSMAMKIVPRIQFSLDSSPQYAQHIAELLEDAKGNEQLGPSNKK